MLSDPQTEALSSVASNSEVRRANALRVFASAADTKSHLSPLRLIDDGDSGTAPSILFDRPNEATETSPPRDLLQTQGSVS